MLDLFAGDTSVLSVSVMSNTPSSSGNICKFFDRGKYCRFGKSCKFLHVRSSADTTNSSCSSKEISDRKQEEEVKEGVTNLVLSTNQNDPTAQSQLCIYFSKNGRCRYGRNCRFEHIRNEVQVAATTENRVKKEESKEDVTIDKQAETLDNASNETKKSNRRTCRYFKSGHCSLGDRCRFRHPERIDPVESKATRPRRRPQKYVPLSSNNIIILEKASVEKLMQSRSTEISQFKKRFPKCEESTDEIGTTLIQFIFVPTDPDWPYDIKAVPLLLAFKDDYPQSMLEVSLVESSEIPLTVHKVVLKSIKAWVSSRFESFKAEGKAELVIRPILKWLDRSIEELFTVGLKQYQKELIAEAAGLTFVTASELQEQYATAGSKNLHPDEEEQTEEEEESDSASSEEESEDDSDEEASTSRPAVSTDPEARGTEVRFVNLQLMNSLATLQPTKVCLQVQCSRCRSRIDVRSPVGQMNAVQCGTCMNVATVGFRAAMVHAESAVFGYADLTDCTLLDVILQDCSFLAGCLACSKEMLLEGAITGQPKDTWCRHCNAKMRLLADGIRSFRLQPALLTDEAKKVHKVESKVKRLPKDPAIQDGLPLPDDGICKHYKKSYRWFRFPCCGKAYPCDVCHDEKEDHPYQFANRMICGHCAKEQSYAAERGCIRCGESLTKARSAHWEGGKGCRDKIKMSRDDKKKYSNLNKTISRKSQGIATGKKNTKLRHS